MDYKFHSFDVFDQFNSFANCKFFDLLWQNVYLNADGT